MKSVLLACLAVLTLTTTALAFSPELVNEDSSSYDYELECGGSTTNSSIDGNSSTSLSSVRARRFAEKSTRVASLSTSHSPFPALLPVEAFDPDAALVREMNSNPLTVERFIAVSS